MTRWGEEEERREKKLQRKITTIGPEKEEECGRIMNKEKK
jgi:hypothetical protein